MVKTVCCVMLPRAPEAKWGSSQILCSEMDLTSLSYIIFQNIVEDGQQRN